MLLTWDLSFQRLTIALWMEGLILFICKQLDWHTYKELLQVHHIYFPTLWILAVFSLPLRILYVGDVKKTLKHLQFFQELFLFLKINPVWFSYSSSFFSFSSSPSFTCPLSSYHRSFSPVLNFNSFFILVDSYKIEFYSWRPCFIFSYWTLPIVNILTIHWMTCIPLYLLQAPRQQGFLLNNSNHCTM